MEPHPLEHRWISRIGMLADRKAAREAERGEDPRGRWGIEQALNAIMFEEIKETFVEG